MCGHKLFLPQLWAFNLSHYGIFAYIFDPEQVFQEMKHCHVVKYKTKTGANNISSDFIWIFLPPYKGVIPTPKMVFIFPILCILVIIFPKCMKIFPKCNEKGSFPKSKIKSLISDPYL